MNSDSDDKKAKRAKYQREYYQKNKAKIHAKRNERQEEIRAYERNRRANDPEYRERLNAARRVDKDRLLTDPEYRERRRAKIKRQNENNKAYRAAYMRKNAHRYRNKNKEHYDEYLDKYNNIRYSIIPIPKNEDFKTAANERLLTVRERASTIDGYDGLAFSTMQVREITGVTHALYYKAIKNGILNTVRVGRYFFILEAELHKYIDHLHAERLTP